MEDKIYQILRNHRLPLKKREELIVDLLGLLDQWVPVSERLPHDEDGEKVLLAREMNDSQKLQSVSVHDPKMVKHCDPNTSYWMRIPAPPNN